MNLETRDQIIFAARAHKITVKAAALLLKQLREVKKIKQESVTNKVAA